MKIEKVNIQKAAQTALVQEAQSAHFYTQQGKARYSDTVKTGANKGKECAVNLRHARSENLYPSITHIHGCLSERALRFYRESHLLAAARHLDILPDESEVDYYHRVNIEARKDSLDAAARGTSVHKSLENILQGGEWDRGDPQLVKAADWLEANIEKTIWMEKTLVNHTLRLAGRCDALVVFKETSAHFTELGSEPVILDFKTRRFKEQKAGWVGASYLKDKRQVAFYASCLTQEARVANLLLNTTPEAPEDLPPHLAIYSREEQFAALVSVGHLSAVWRHENGYQPKEIDVPPDEKERMAPVLERMVA